VYHRLGLALEGQKRVDAAKAAYRRAVDLGYGAARFELERLETASRELLAPGHPRGARP
jgi:hypothetical protein